MSIDIVVMGGWPAMEAMLAEKFTLHRAYQAPDFEAFLLQVAARARAIVTNPTCRRLTGEIMDMLPNAKIIHGAGVGVDNIDLDAARARGITVTYGQGASALDVAEIALGMMIDLARKMGTNERYCRAGKWVSQGRAPFNNRLSGRKLGLVGMGMIGQEVARLAAPLRMETAYYTRHARPNLPYRHEPDLVKLAREVDILVVSLPGGADTHHIVDRAVIEALGPKGILISVGRGSAIDEPEMVRALQDGRLGQAGIDVYENEPHVPEALFTLENVALQPHMAGATMEALHRSAEIIVENLEAHFAGRPVPTPVG